MSGALYLSLVRPQVQKYYMPRNYGMQGILVKVKDIMFGRTKDYS
jgi:hypothetical protein